MPDDKKKETKKQLDEEALSKEFENFLQEKGYEVVRAPSDDDDDLDSGDVSEEEAQPLPKRIRRVTEDLNNCAWPFTVFVNTTKLLPGVVCYVVEPIAPNNKTPYVTYKPSQRVITEIHDTGVNRGTLFYSYAHKIITHLGDINGRDIRVIAEEEAIYSPLTKSHAEYVCKLLNLQSKHMYQKALLAIKENQKAK